MRQITAHNATLAILVSLISWPLLAQGLPTAEAHEVGLSAQRLERLGSVLQDRIDNGEMVGAVTLIARHGKIAHFETLGHMDQEGGKVMPQDAIFRIASMTKPITSVAVMILFEEGRFLLDDPVSRYIPAFKNMRVAIIENPADPNSSYDLVPAASEITIRHLLSHTSGLTYGGFNPGPVGKLYRDANLWRDPKATLADFVTQLAKLPLVHHPGTAWEYGVSTDVLGRLIEVISGQTFGDFLEERIFGPLKMKDTAFHVPREKIDRLAVHYSARGAGDLRPSPTFRDFSTPPSLPSGGGGLASTANDYGRFLQMLLNDGEIGGVRILGRKTVELMTADHTRGLTERGVLGQNFGFGLGFAVRGPLGNSGVPGSPGTFSWGGVFNTFFWVDPEEELYAVFMTQISPFGYLDLSNRFKSLTYQALVD